MEDRRYCYDWPPHGKIMSKDRGRKTPCISRNLVREQEASRRRCTEEGTEHLLGSFYLTWKTLGRFPRRRRKSLELPR